MSWKSIPTGLDGSPSSTPSLYLDRRSDPYCAWILDEELNFAFFGGDWFHLGETTATGILADQLPRHNIALDQYERPHILYWKDGDLCQVEWNGRQWTANASGRKICDTTLSATAEYNGELYFFRISDALALNAIKSDSGWTTLDTLLIDADNQVFDLLARSVGDKIYVFWKVVDGTDGRIEYSVFDTSTETFSIANTILFSDGSGEITDMWFVSREWLPIEAESSSSSMSNNDIGLLCWTKKVDSEIQVHACWISDYESAISPLLGSQVNTYTTPAIQSDNADFLSPYYASISGYHCRSGLRLTAVSECLTSFAGGEGRIWESCVDTAARPLRVVHGIRPDGMAITATYLKNGSLTAQIGWEEESSEDQEWLASSSSSSFGQSSSSSSTFVLSSYSSSSRSSMSNSSLSQSSSTSQSPESASSHTSTSCSWCHTSSSTP